MLGASTTPQRNGTHATHRARGRSLGWAIGAGFVGLAAWLGTRSPALDVPVIQGAMVEKAMLGSVPRRAAMGDPPAALIDGSPRACTECHAPLDLELANPMQASPHHVALKHGMNDWCFNCHDAAQRERLGMQDLTTIGFADVPRLCAQCHGTTYRDWQRGMHGKTMGSWEKTGGLAAQRRLLCTECHDPHAPAYPRLTPLPGPNTLRMNPMDDQGGEGHELRSPLRPPWTEHSEQKGSTP
jgi:hypothetical protein